MRSVPFIKMSPGGNTTILIPESAHIARQERVVLAQKFLNELHLHAEQVGFVQARATGLEAARLDMMGGEFCGNATRCLAAWLAEEHGDAMGACIERLVSVSGVEKPLRTMAKRLEPGIVDTSVEMPVIAAFDCITLPEDGVAIVKLGGITHVLFNQSTHNFPASTYGREAKKLRAQYGLEHEEAVGCIWYELRADAVAINPVVWVRDTDSTYYETACGSGTIAVALLLAWQNRENMELNILQPSKARIVARVELSADKSSFHEAWIGGPVRTIAQGIAYA